MNPITNMKNVLKLSENDLARDYKTSWHDQYRDSAWIFIGGLPYDLTEGDVISVFSQYGEIVNINLIRDKITGKSKGFCFICYEDQRSTILTVDNLNGIKLLGRIIRVDHVSNYRAPKEYEKMDEVTKLLQMEGCAPKAQIPVESIKREPEPKVEFSDGFKLPMRLPIGKVENIKKEKGDDNGKARKRKANEKKSKKSKHKKHKKHKKKKSSSSSSSNDSD